MNHRRDAGTISGSLVVNIEGSEYKGEQCMFVTISTGFNRDRNHGSQNFCQVSGFVNFELVTLEERRLITTRYSDKIYFKFIKSIDGNNNNQFSKQYSSHIDIITTFFDRLYTTEEKGYKLSHPMTASSDYCTTSETDHGISENDNASTPSYIEDNKSKRIVHEFQTCRSIVLDESQDDTRRFIKVAEWQRNNGKLVVQKNLGRDGIPSSQTYHQLELPQNSAFLTDISLLLAEKLMARTTKTGKFDKISTLDKRCLFAPLCLESRRDVKDNFSGEIIKILKSSPVDKGATETSYSMEGNIRDRTIITAKKLRYHLKNVNNNTCSSDVSSSSDEDNNSNHYKKIATNQFYRDMRFSDRFFAENLHDTINRNLSILRQRMFDENLRRNLVKMYTVISGRAYQPKASIAMVKTDTKLVVNNDATSSDNNDVCTVVSNTEVKLQTGNSKNELAEAMPISPTNNTDSIVCLIKTALCEVLLHKPDDPLAYLKQYFKDLRDKKEVKVGTNANKKKAPLVKDTKLLNGKRKEITRSKSDAKLGNKLVRTSRPHSSSDIVTLNR